MKTKLSEVISLCKKLDAARQQTSAPDEFQLAGLNLFEYSSFRLSVGCNNQRTIGFSMMKAALYRGFRSAPNKETQDNADGIIISSSSCDHANVQFYIKSMSGLNHLRYIIKDQLSFRDQFDIREWLSWFVFAFAQSIRIIFSKERSNRALTIIEVLEIALLMKIVEQQRIQKIFDFVPFEVDSNLLYLCTRRLGAKTTKIPSPGPLSMHNSIVLTDTLVLSSGYHFEELPLLKKNFRFVEQIIWAPERAHTYYHLYTLKDYPEQRKHIGFYSHGEWVRKIKGLVKETSSLLSAEDETLRMLGQWVHEHRDYTLTIYPHPKERKSFDAEALTEYYRKTIGHTHFKLASADKGTTLRFHEVDVAVTCYSTIIFERLYCGFKTIIKKIDEHEFPKSDSPLNSVCFENYDELEKLLLQCESLTDADFFKTFALDKYLHHHYPTPKAQ
jgi:hypothetical protein